MYCLQCGQQLPDDAVFCLKCGAPQTASGGQARGLLEARYKGDPGIYLHRTPSMDDYDPSELIENYTMVEDLGEEVEAEGHRWRKVRLMSGRPGWVPWQHMIPSLTFVEDEFVRYYTMWGKGLAITITNKRIHFGVGGYDDVPLRMISRIEAGEGWLLGAKDVYIYSRGREISLTCQSREQAKEIGQQILNAIAGL